jgi:hypothetical protein
VEVAVGVDVEGPMDRVLGASVRWGPVPDDLAGARTLRTSPGERLMATDDEALYANDYVRLLIRGTDEVHIEARGGLEPGAVAHNVYGFAARILLLHAGCFSLHASVVDTPSAGALAVGGDSGAGKSTTAVALMQEPGCRLVIDDVAPLRVDGAAVLVEPFPRPVHLYAEAAARLGFHVPAAAPLPEGAPEPPKLALAIGDPTPVRLRRLAVLRVVAPQESSAALALRPIAGAERFRAVVRLANSTGIASAGNRRAAFFAWAAEVADRLAMVEVSRRADADTLPAVVSALLADWE